MNIIRYSVHDIWANDELLTTMVIRFIEESGRYEEFNKQWQVRSTMIDYALKRLKKNQECQRRILDKLSKIGYVPLFRVSNEPSIRPGELLLSSDGVIGVNIHHATVSNADYCTSFEDSIDVILTGSCQPIFTIVEKDLKHNTRVSISPDSKKLAVVAADTLTVWDIAECRTIYVKRFDPDYDNRQVFWSGDSKSVIRTHYRGFLVTDVETRQQRDVSYPLLDSDPTNIIVNDDATEFIFLHENDIKLISKTSQFGVIESDNPYLDQCYLVKSKDSIWALLGDEYYLIEDGELVLKGCLDDAVDSNPYRFSDVIGDYGTQSFFERDSFSGHCDVIRDGLDVIFKTDMGMNGTHYIVIESDSLEMDQWREPEQMQHPIISKNEKQYLNEDYAYLVKNVGHEGESRFFLFDGNEEIPMGTCRYDAKALLVNDKIFIHKGRTIEVYDCNDLQKPLFVRDAFDTDKWAIAGSDSDGTVYLVKATEVQKGEEGSNAKILFARMNAPDFKLKTVEDAFIEVDKVWNLRFGLVLRNGIVFHYNRDGNRVKPVTLNRYKLLSKKMVPSYTLRCDESKFSSRICELSDHRVAVVSLDELEDNPLKESRVTIRFLDCNDAMKSEMCDLTKTSSIGHFKVIGIQEVICLDYDGVDHVIVQFLTPDGSIICSTDSRTRKRFPEKSGLIKGVIVGSDRHILVVRDEYGKYSLYDARLNLLESDASFKEPDKETKWLESSIPLNKSVDTNFGRILQTSGVFFCLNNTE